LVFVYYNFMGFSSRVSSGIWRILRDPFGGLRRS